MLGVYHHVHTQLESSLIRRVLLFFLILLVTFLISVAEKLTDTTYGRKDLFGLMALDVESSMERQT